MVVVLDDGEGPIELDLMVPDLEAMPRFYRSVPPYLPRYHHRSEPEKALVNLLMHRIETVADHELREQYIATRNDMAAVYNSHYFGNGCPPGQIGRFLAVRKVFDRVKKSFGTRYNSMSHYSKTAALLFNFTAKPSDYGIDTFTSNLADLMRAASENMTPIHGVVMSSDPGLIWPEDVKRRDTFPFDIQLAQQLMDAMPTTDVKEEWDMFWERYSWLRLVKPKPKEEVYTREQYTTKTRNIYVLASFSQLPLQLMIRRPLHDMLNYRDQTDRDWETDAST